jgi:hypothetical protein
MTKSGTRLTRTFNWILILHFLLLSISLYSQSSGPGIIGKSFLALNVSNADSAGRWYEEMFGLKLLKEIKPVDGSVHIRIEGNEFLLVEILQMKDSKTILDCQLQKAESHLLRGFFKAGLLVKDAQKAADYFKARSVVIKHGIFSDN